MLSGPGPSEGDKQPRNAREAKTCPLSHHRHFPHPERQDLLGLRLTLTSHGGQDSGVEVVPRRTQNTQGGSPLVPCRQPETQEGTGRDRKAVGSPEGRLREDDKTVYLVVDKQARVSQEESSVSGTLRCDS